MNDPDNILVPTNDPGQTCAEHEAKGWRLSNIYVTKFYRKLVDLTDHRHWVCQFWRPSQPDQRELL